MLRDLYQAVAKLNVSRHAVIKAFVRQALDRHRLTQGARKASCLRPRSRFAQKHPRTKII